MEHLKGLLLRKENTLKNTAGCRIFPSKLLRHDKLAFIYCIWDSSKPLHADQLLVTVKKLVELHGVYFPFAVGMVI